MKAFVPCRNCGKYRVEGEDSRSAYCTEECSRAYVACVNCGKYFLKGKGFDGEHCSKDCTVRYVITRKYGPQPVTVATEV